MSIFQRAVRSPLVKQILEDIYVFGLAIHISIRQVSRGICEASLTGSSSPPWFFPDNTIMVRTFAAGICILEAQCGEIKTQMQVNVQAEQDKS
jgi:hypothetical protein